MFEPVELNNILIAGIAGALVVLFGALYALAFALGRLNRMPWLTGLAYLFFALLTVSVFVLANTLNLNGIWQAVTATLLAGYLMAPHGIWKLCTGTHSGADESPAPTLHATGENHE
jgi:hypothetical protein